MKRITRFLAEIRAQSKSKVLITLGGILSFIVLLIILLLFFVQIKPSYFKELELIEEKLHSMETTARSNKNKLDGCRTRLTELDDCKQVQERRKIYQEEDFGEYYVRKVNTTNWVNLHSDRVGISFMYPVEEKNNVFFSFSDWPIKDYDPSGISFRWSYSDVHSDYEYSTIAYGASKDIKVGRMSVEVYNWTEKDGKYFLNDRDTNYEVKKLKVYDMEFGTQALLYEGRCFFFCEGEVNIPGSKVLIVNLPWGHRERIEGVTFTIPAYFTDDDINKLLDSIELLD